jgi:hypothetical protein
MSRSNQQSDELFLPPSAHPYRASFFDYPSSPTYLFDEESGTFKTVWPAPSATPQVDEAVEESEWEDVRPPSPLRTPSGKQYYQTPKTYRQQEFNQPEHMYGSEYSTGTETFQSQSEFSSERSQPFPLPTTPVVQRRSDHEIGRALSPPSRQRVALYDKPMDDYDHFQRRVSVDVDGVSEASFSDQSPKEGRLYLPSSRDPVSPSPLDISTSKARGWPTPRRDATMEVPITINPECDFQKLPEADYQRQVKVYEERPKIFTEPGTFYKTRPFDQMYHCETVSQRQQRARVFTDFGTLASGAAEDTGLEQLYQLPFESQQNHQQQRPRIFSDPGTVIHCERRIDLAHGRSSMPPQPSGNFDEQSSSFKVLNVQRVPVGSLEIKMSSPRREDSKKLKMWKKIKGFVS